jgi:hypothetical protein
MYMVQFIYILVKNGNKKYKYIIQIIKHLYVNSEHVVFT